MGERYKAQVIDERWVCCGGCKHFAPNGKGMKGIGTCRINGQGREIWQMPLYPRARRICRDFDKGV